MQVVSAAQSKHGRLSVRGEREVPKCRRLVEGTNVFPSRSVQVLQQLQMNRRRDDVVRKRRNDPTKLRRVLDLEGHGQFYSCRHYGVSSAPCKSGKSVLEM